MKHRLQITFLATVVAAAFGSAGVARANLPPPNGTKFVSYSFAVANADAFKGYALLAFRCDAGSHDAFTVVEGSSSLSVGRHGGACEIYAMKRDDYDAWKKSAHLTGDWTDPALDALLKDPRVHKCSGGPNITFTLPTTDARSEVAEALKLQTLDDKGCAFVAASTSSSGSGTSGASSSGGGPIPTSSVTPAPSTSTTPSPPPVRACGGCAVEDQQSRGHRGAGLLGLAIGAAAMWRRRRAR